MSDEADQSQPLTGHERRLANLRPFQKGNTFGKNGRPKDLARFGTILMGMFYKSVPVQLGGKVVNKMQGDVLAMQMMKAAINGTMSDRRLLLQFIEAHEVREAKREELRLKKQANGSQEIDWDAEREIALHTGQGFLGVLLGDVHPENANLRPFQKGNTFGAKGRPKDLARFGSILMGEFYKTVPANLAGKPQGELLACR